MTRSIGTDDTPGRAALWLRARPEDTAAAEWIDRRRLASLEHSRQQHRSTRSAARRRRAVIVRQHEERTVAAAVTVAPLMDLRTWTSLPSKPRTGDRLEDARPTCRLDHLSRSGQQAPPAAPGRKHVLLLRAMAGGTGRPAQTSSISRRGEHRDLLDGRRGAAAVADAGRRNAAADALVEAASRVGVPTRRRRRSPTHVADLSTTRPPAEGRRRWRYRRLELAGPRGDSDDGARDRLETPATASLLDRSERTDHESLSGSHELETAMPSAQGKFRVGHIADARHPRASSSALDLVAVT